MRKNPQPDTEDYNPARNFIIIRPEIEPEKTEGGIIIPEQARNFLNEGEILKTGPEVSSDLQPGMFITFTTQSEFRLKMNDGSLVFAVAEDNVILTRQPRKKLFPAENCTCEKDPLHCPLHSAGLPEGN